MATCIRISIEGGDGSGKATTTKLVKKYLVHILGKRVATMSFPRYKETTGGKILNEVLKSERKEDYNFISLSPSISALPYLMDRAESKTEISELTLKNDYLIFDRYVASNFIHQGGKISDDDEREVIISFLSHLEYDLFALPKPDITFFLYLPTEVAMRNKANQRLNDENVKTDAGEDDFAYLDNSNRSGLWCVEKYGWKQINCIDPETGLQKQPEVIVAEIVKILGF